MYRNSDTPYNINTADGTPFYPFCRVVKKISLLQAIFLYRKKERTNNGISLYLSNLILTWGVNVFSYIKPQLREDGTLFNAVVSLYIPTSNHNLPICTMLSSALFLYIFLHQTTTHHYRLPSQHQLFLYIFLHQTTTQVFYLSKIQVLNTLTTPVKWFVNEGLQHKITKKVPNTKVL